MEGKKLPDKRGLIWRDRKEAFKEKKKEKEKKG